jgi:Bacterial Ig-like domain (group 3)/FG-GAP-like repeat
MKLFRAVLCSCFYLIAFPASAQIAPNFKGDFQSELRFSAGPGPVAIAIGDLNGDGHPDAVVADYNGNSVSILLGNGDGTFGSPTLYTTGDYSYAVALADLNGDGHLDIVCANLNLDHLTQGGTLSVLLGNGDGTFATAVNYVAGNDLSSVVLADFNGDGKIDIATTDVSSSNVAILLNKGNGTFQAAVEYAAGPNPLSLAASDFNGDGKVDLVVTNVCDVSLQNFNCTPQQNTISVLLGHGDGTFAAPVSYQAGSAPYVVKVQDVNSDGRPDLLVSNFSLALGSLIPTLSLLLGNGDGTFQAPSTYASGGWTLETGDIAGDGVSDVIMGSSAGLIEILGGSPGTFYAPVRYFVQLDNFSPIGNVAIADLNGDGRPDVAIAEGMVLAVFLNAGGTTRQATTVTITSSQNPSLVNAPPALTASVTPTGSTLQGTVTFYVDGQAVYVSSSSGIPITGELNSSNQATCCNFNSTFNPLTVGTHSIVAIYSGDTITQGSTSATFTQTVSPLPTTTTLSSSPNPSQIGQSVTFTATITTTENTGIFQGTVTFFEGSNALGTVPVVGDLRFGATATLSVSNLTVGTHSMTASYSGGGNFGTSTSSSLQQVVNGTMSLVVSKGDASSATVTAGSTAQYSLTIGGAGFAGQTTVTCGGAPTGATCSVTPSNLMVSATTPTTLNVSLTTTSRTSASLQRRLGTSGLVWAVILFGFIALPHKAPRLRFKTQLFLIPLFLAALAISSCGGGGGGTKINPDGTPAGTYNISVQAKSGSVTGSVSLTLTVQ